MMPPLITVGSKSPASSSAATIEVVVVLPCVPAIATQLFSRISSASISARRTTGRRFARAATSSGIVALDRRRHDHDLGAVDILGRRGRSKTLAPLSRSRLTLALSHASEPCTV